VSRKVGNAVVRNRVKRCVRNWFRTSRDEIVPGADIVVIARRSASGLSSTGIETRLSEMLAGDGGSR